MAGETLAAALIHVQVAASAITASIVAEAAQLAALQAKAMVWPAVAATVSVTLSAANSAALAAAAAVAVVVVAAAVAWSYAIMPAHMAVLCRTASLLAHHKPRILAFQLVAFRGPQLPTNLSHATDGA
jgi:hypothetical protein